MYTKYAFKASLQLHLHIFNSIYLGHNDTDLKHLAHFLILFLKGFWVLNIPRFNYRCLNLALETQRLLY